jgi:hypothetical protein
MVNKAKERWPLTGLFPNATLDSDWDVIAELWNTLESLNDNSSISFEHIKGHQDDKIDYQELSLPAQLNVDADRIADSFLENHPDATARRVPLLPSAKAQLHLPKGTITYKLKRELRLARTTEPLIKHMCKKNDWTREVYNTIDIKAHGQGLERQRSHESTYVKYCHNVVPVGRHVHRINPKYPHNCPSCNQEGEETIDHLLHCQAPTREQWRKDTLTEVRHKMDSLNTPLPIMELFMSGLYSVLYPGTHIHVPPGLEALAAAQSAIGWHHIMKGRFAVQWRENIDRHNGSAHGQKPGARWAVDMVDCVLKQWWKVWMMRNGDRHGRDAATKAQAERQQAIREMQQLYDLKDTVLPQHQWILSQPIETKLQWTTPVIRAWISNYRVFIEEGHNTALETG